MHSKTLAELSAGLQAGDFSSEELTGITWIVSPLMTNG